MPATGVAFGYIVGRGIGSARQGAYLEHQNFLSFIESYQRATRAIVKGSQVDFRGFAPGSGAAIAIEAKDGWMVVYPSDRPAKRTGSKPNRFWVDQVTRFDYTTRTLAEVAQSATITTVVIADWKVGQPPVPFEPWPSSELATRGIPDFLVTMSIEFLEGLSDEFPVAPTLLATPHVVVEQGVITAVLPYRAQFLVPVVVRNGSVVHMHTWNQIDFWWKPEALLVGGLDPEELARRDLAALEFIVSDPRFPVEAPPPQQETRVEVAERLLQLCDEFLALLESDGEREEVLHQWLHRHPIFMDLRQQRVLSKVPFGNKTSDFVIQRADRTYCLCELEAASKAPLTTKGEQPSQHLVHACTQVNDWRRYISDNPHTVWSELDLKDMRSPSGMVVIGRRKSLGKDGAHRWARMQTEGYENCGVRTYDDLITEVQSLAQTLRTIC